MNGTKFRYNFINIAVILITTALFINDYKSIGTIFQNRVIIHILITVISVFVVHVIKAGRLYLALYGSDISFSEYLKVYCKVTPVSVVIPFKLGEFFRMYCYGKILGSVLKGIIIVLLDRFMDTIALVTMILLVWLFNGGYITSFVYILLIFLMSAFLVYLVLPGVYKFWKRYILRAKATEYKLSALKALDMLNRIHKEISNVSRGRGIILYFMSLIAWGVEIGSIALQIGLFNDGDLNQIISDYLTSAMRSNQSVELRQFVFVSVIMMIAIYVAVKFTELLPRKKVQE